MDDDDATPPPPSWPPAAGAGPGADRVTVPCGTCGQPTDVRAAACSRCGHPIEHVAPVTASGGRRPSATWGIVTGSLVIVVALVVGLLVTAGGGSGSSARAHGHPTRYPDPSASTTTRPAPTPIESSSLDATMLTPADLGPGWLWTEPEYLEATDHSGEECAALPALAGDALRGRTVHLEQDGPDGEEIEVVRIRVREFGTVDEAAARMAAQASPAFAPCVQQEDVISTACSCRTTATPVALGATAEPAPAGVQAVVFHDAVTFVNADGPGIWYLRRAYLQRGRVTVSVVAEGLTEMPQPQWETLLRTISDRLGSYIPPA
jgi:hypothetical protein